MHDTLATLYPAHLAAVRQHVDAALEAAHLDTLVIPSGRPMERFLDDQNYPFSTNPHFKYWLPLLNTPGSWLVVTPGKKPQLIFLQPRDYWHVVPQSPSGYWVDQFDITVVHQWADARQYLPSDLTRCAVIGHANDALDDVVPNNPPALLDYLHYQRAYKTPYELALMREASRIGTRAHTAAATAFRLGESEFGIYMAYLSAAQQTESELPYASIIGLNAHGAVLHYSDFERTPPAQNLSLLIDAGANACGYASDITRTYAAPEATEFQALIDSVETAQQDFCSRVRNGQDYGELHMHAHHTLAGVLKEHDIVRMSPESALASGVSNIFYPHGLGHLIGLQVHDVGGFQKGVDGGRIEQPAGQPFLRLTRTLAPDMVVTIEPGLYFIDMLLAKLKAKPEAKHIHWAKVDALRPYGGIRIEDDVACTDDAPENLTRNAFAAV